MPEPIDVIMPILQRIQADVSDLKRDVAAVAHRMEKIEDYVTYSLGVLSQQKVDIDRQGKALLELARRVDALEHAT